MELEIQPQRQPWKGAMLALLFIAALAFATAWTLRRPGPAAKTMCRCPHTNPAQRCFCPPLGNSCPCER